MKKTILLALAGIMTSYSLFSQKTDLTSGSVRHCGTEKLSDEYEKWIQPLIQEQELKNAALKSSGTTTIFTIPIVFHVIHTGTAVGVAFNVSDAQLLSQIDVLNEDFRKLNADTALTPSAFKPVAADCEIQFCLAQRDPNGNASTGIDRINRTTAGFSTPPYTDTYINTVIKPATIWNPNNYLNIWVVPTYTSAAFGFQILGHATFPSGSTLTGITSGTGTATTDGVVIWYKSLGRSVPGLDQSYNLGRTATHEIGHWLGLRHIWGDGTCASDYCTDTPTQNTANYGCPVFPSTTCNNGANGDMFMNFMDYCNDSCLNLFTLNQKTRMVTALNNSPMRINQRNSIACIPVGLDEMGTLKMVTIFPNPANDQLNLELGHQLSSENISIRILNILGAEMTTLTLDYQPNGKYLMDVSALNAGFYLLEIHASYGSKTLKFQVSR